MIIQPVTLSFRNNSGYLLIVCVGVGHADGYSSRLFLFLSLLTSSQRTGALSSERTPYRTHGKKRDQEAFFFGTGTVFPMLAMYKA